MSYFDRFTDNYREHERDLRHDEPRASDPVPTRFIMPMATALEVAVLVKGVKDVRKAAELVEQYAQTVAAAARLDAVAKTGERILRTIEAHQVQR